MAVTDSGKAELVSILLDADSSDQLRRFVEGDIPQNRLSVSDIVPAIMGCSSDVCIAFHTRDGIHYVTESCGELRAIYLGKHGVENRPARVDKDTIEQLLSYAETAEVSLVQQTELSNSVVADLL